MIKNAGKFNGAGLKALDARIRALEKKTVVVGVPASKNADRDGTNIVTIAAAHEFGVAGHIPERSFLRSTLNENRENISGLLIKSIHAMPQASDGAMQPFSVVGEKLAGEVKRKIISGINPALDPVTVKRKKSSGTLIDTGLLLQSITCEVRDDG